MRSVHKTLETVATLPTREAKIQYLRQNTTPALQKVVQFAYDSRIKWLVPEGAVEYRPLKGDQMEGSEQVLLKEARTMYIFVEGDTTHNPNVKPERRYAKFVELLEAAHPDDAKVLLAARNRSLPWLDKDTAREAFPELIQ